MLDCLDAIIKRDGQRCRATSQTPRCRAFFFFFLRELSTAAPTRLRAAARITVLGRTFYLAEPARRLSCPWKAQRAMQAHTIRRA